MVYVYVGSQTKGSTLEVQTVIDSPHCIGLGMLPVQIVDMYSAYDCPVYLAV